MVISPADIYAEVRSLTTAVQALVATDKAEANERADVKAKVASLAETKADKTEVSKIEARLSAVEKRLLFATGFAAAIGASAGSYLPTLIK